MTDIKAPGSAVLSAHFDAKAALPRNELGEATRFVDDLRAAADRGESIAAEHLQTINSMLTTVEERLESAGWSLAVMIGQHSDTEADIDRQIAEHQNGIDHISSAVSTLRNTVRQIKA